MDYAPVIDQVLEFESCQRQVCIEIGILTDSELEDTEQFTVSIGRSSGVSKRIRFIRRKKTISILNGVPIILLI